MSENKTFTNLEDFGKHFGIKPISRKKFKNKNWKEKKKFHKKEEEGEEVTS